MSDKQSSDTKPSPAELRMVSNERGSVLALVALCLVMFLGLAALAIDLGLLHVARGEAQRAADAGAHAGAGYLMANPNATPDEIAAEAIRVGQLNSVRGEAPDIRREDVEVLRDERKVRVWAHRTSDRNNPVPTIFSVALGFDAVSVNAMAAAQIWPGDGVKCLLPFAAPDRWWVDSIPQNYPGPGDQFDAEADWYEPWDKESPNDPFSGYSTDDTGYEIQIYAGDPGEAPQPSWWYPFTLEGGQPSAQQTAAAIRDCVDPERYNFGDDMEVHTAPGAMVGPIRDAFDYLINEDPKLYWAGGPTSPPNCVLREDEEDRGCVTSSPRIRPMALYDPRLPPTNGFKPFNLMNIVGVFIDDVEIAAGDVRVTVRFMRYTALEPAAEWHEGDTNLQILRIVE